MFLCIFKCFNPFYNAAVYCCSGWHIRLLVGGSVARGVYMYHAISLDKMRSFTSLCLSIQVYNGYQVKVKVKPNKMLGPGGEPWNELASVM